MSETMIERVARAIAANMRSLPPDHADVDAVWTSYWGEARAAIEAMLGWQPIEEADRNATRRGGLGFDQTTSEYFVVWRDGGDTWCRLGDDYDIVVAPTHWMPLPPPPTTPS